MRERRRWVARSLALVAATLALTGALLAGAAGAAPAGPGDSAPAARYDSGGVGAGRLPVVCLRGSYRQMGRQYGRLLAGRIRALNAAVHDLYGQNQIVIDDDPLPAFSRRMLALYPARLRLLAKGVAEGAHVSIGAVAENSEFFEYLAACVPAPSPQGLTGACSAISAWGPYTTDGRVVMGRDFDFPPFVRALDPYLVVVVLHPSDGSTPTALLTWAGAVGGISGFNASGLVLENNDASSYGDTDRYFGQRTPFLAELPQVLLDHTSLPGADAALRSYRGPYPLIWNLATPEAGYVYETTTHEVKRRGGADGLAVGVNHFVDPSWPVLPTRSEQGITYSELRHGNLLGLAAAYSGRIDAARMRAIVDTLVDDGGPTPEDENIYRYVALPGTLQWWIKAPDHVGWVHVDLARFFSARRAQLTVLEQSAP